MFYLRGASSGGFRVGVVWNYATNSIFTQNVVMTLCTMPRGQNPPLPADLSVMRFPGPVVFFSLKPPLTPASYPALGTV